MYAAANAVTATLFAVLLIILAAIALRAWRRSRVTPEERERQRRAMLVFAGKMGDANLLEVTEDVLVYTYDVRGVEYIASQDVTHLKSFLPEDLGLMDPVAIRYDPRNPANSIVVAEEWSGLRP